MHKREVKDGDMQPARNSDMGEQPNVAPEVTSRSGEKSESGVPDVNGEIGQFFDALYNEIHKYCVIRLYRHDLAKDAVSDVFVRFIERYPGFRDKSRPYVRCWLYGTARNVIRRYRRDDDKQKRIREALQNGMGSRIDVPPRHGDAIDRAKLYEAMETLKPKDQEIVGLRYSQGLNATEIADRLGMKAGTVRAHLSRATSRLRQELGI